MKERELLELLAARMPRSPWQVGALFEADAEILPFGQDYLLFSTDEFSDEDLFLTKNPYSLGHNIACATLSDILAAGGTPLYYAHSLTADERFDQKYISRFYDGIADVLKSADVSFIGGDFGRAKDWRCCASAIGLTKKPILRSGACPGDHIYITGPVGAGNIQAALSLYTFPLKGRFSPDFTLRHNVLSDIRRYATSCIDTSDGLFQAVRTIARMSKTGFALEPSIPYLPIGKTIAKLTHLPLEMLMFCECGEYELLFTAAEKDLPYFCIGRITETEEEMTYGDKDVSHIDLSARSHKDLKEYLREVQKLCEEL